MADYVQSEAIYSSEAVAITEFRCRCRSTALSGEEVSDTDAIVFPRRGAFRKHTGSDDLLADSNQVVFFAKGAPYRVSHPDTNGDDCLSLRFAPDLLIDAFGPRAADAHARGAALLSPTAVAIDAAMSVRLHGVYRGATRGAAPLALEELAVSALADIAQRARERQFDAARYGATRRTRGDTEEAYRELVSSAWSTLCARFREPLTLGEIAEAANSSRFHLARVFRRATGRSLHEYQTRLRLSESLRRLCDGHEDLTQLALDLGFSSHSHFTFAFRRMFGVAPTHFRQRGAGL